LSKRCIEVPAVIERILARVRISQPQLNCLPSGVSVLAAEQE